jgi:hypothetical protein
MSLSKKTLGDIIAHPEENLNDFIYGRILEESKTPDEMVENLQRWLPEYGERAIASLTAFHFEKWDGDVASESLPPRPEQGLTLSTAPVHPDPK